MSIISMRLSKCVFVLMLLGLLVGCNKLKGEKGDAGAAGATGATGDTGAQGENATFNVFTGTVPGSRTVSIGSGILPSNTHVTVMYAFQSIPDVWIELGGSPSANAWAAVNYDESEVFFFNVTGELYKIIVMTPASSPPLSAKERFDYF